MRIAHFSDLHVLALDGVPTHRFLNKRFTGWVNLRVKRAHKHRPSHVRGGDVTLGPHHLGHDRATLRRHAEPAQTQELHHVRVLHRPPFHGRAS